MGLIDDLRHQAGCLDSDTERATADLLYRAADAIEAAEARAEKAEVDNARMVKIITALQNDAAAIRPLLRRAYRYVSVNAIDAARAEGAD